MTTTDTLLHAAVALGASAFLTLGCTRAQPPAQSTASGAAPADVNAGSPELPSAVNAGQRPTNALLDDLEDGDAQVVAVDQRSGYWYTYADPSTSIEPQGQFKASEGGAAESRLAARMHGEIGDEQYPYAGMGFSLTEPKAPYDLSACQGVSFQARKGSQESTGMLRLKVGDVNTVPEGGVCKECYNDFGEDVLLTEEWREIVAPFAKMRQEPSWGEPRPALDATRVYQLQFQVKDRGPFDIWVDDVKLIGCGQTPDAAPTGSAPEEPAAE